jgi:hypothetical protein
MYLSGMMTINLAAEQLMMSNKAYIDKCDKTDGCKDGLVSWPEMCSYDQV